MLFSYLTITILLLVRYVNMEEMSNPDSLSPNRLNQALISETLSEFPHFEFVSTNTPDEAASSHPEVNGQAQQDPVVYGIEMDQGKFKTQNSNIYSTFS